MDKIPFEDGTLVKAGYVEIDGVKYETVQPEYTGKTPLSAYNLKKMQDNIEKSINEEKLVKRINISGASKQENREGYNLFNHESRFYGNEAEKNVVVELDKNVLTATGTSNSTARFWVGGLTVGETYSFICKNNTFVSIQIIQSNNAKEWIGEKTRVTTKDACTNITADTEAIIISMNNSSKLSTTISDVMVIEGAYTNENAPAFEQYGASPSIEHEAPIESVGDNINLFDKDNASTLNGYLYNGKIVSSDNTNIIIIIAIKPNKTYSISKMLQATANKNRLSLGTTTDYPVAGATLNVAKINSDGTTKTSETITSSENDNYLVAQIYTKDTTSLEEMLSSIKIVEGISTGAYSPYGQGSIEIYNCNGNFLKNEATTQTINGIKFTVNEDGTVIANGTATANAVLVLNSSIKINQEDMRIKGCPTGGSTSTFALGLRGNNNGQLIYDTGNGNNINATDTEYTARIVIFSGTTVNNLLFAPMITKGLAEYVPHQSQTKALYTQQPFRAIGDVKDRFVKQNGVWYEEHKINHLVFNGTENWGLQTEKEKTNVYKYYNTSIFPNNRTQLLSNYFVDKIDSGDIEGIIIQQQQCYLAINKETAPTLDDFKAKLTELYNSGTPVYVDYVLATPTLIPCTPEQVEVLNDIYSAYGEGMTNIICNDEIEPVIEIVKETKETVQSENDKAISALLARVTELEELVASLQNTAVEEGT